VKAQASFFSIKQFVARYRLRHGGSVSVAKLRPVDGGIRNAYPLAAQPRSCTASWYVHGYFRENLVGRIDPAQTAFITLMGYPDQPVTGKVDSIGWGIYQDDGAVARICCRR
jgi:hypothetical protein